MDGDAGGSVWNTAGRKPDEGLLRDVPGVSGGEDRGAAKLRLFREMVTHWERKEVGSTTVLFWDRFLWYRSAIALGEANWQTFDCVGKVCAGHIASALRSLQPTADTKSCVEARHSKVVAVF
jgi:hypothetical protein